MRQSSADVIPFKGYERFCTSRRSQETRGVVHGLAVLSFVGPIFRLFITMRKASFLGKVHLI